MSDRRGRYGDGRGQRGGRRGDDPSYYRRNQPYNEGGRDTRQFRGDDRPHRGGFDRGRDRGYGGRGGYRDRPRGGGYTDGQAPESVEYLQSENMFEELTNATALVEGNPTISGCGEMYGSHGKPQFLHSNYFRVTNLPNRTLYQYHVTYDPEIASQRARYAILMKLDIMKGHVVAFDGAILYVPFEITDGEYVSSDRNESPVKISIKLVATIASGSPPANAVINVIMKRVMRCLNLKLIKRHYFDPRSPKEFREGQLEVWPGYSSTLTYFGKIPFYCVDVAHHVIRQQSALDFFQELISSTADQRSVRAELERQLVGKIVMTRYNNRSYRIDAIDWDKSPQSTFKKKDGSELTYVDYYKNQYNITLNDVRQPMLVSQLKERRRLHEAKESEQRGESVAPNDQIVHLVPELVFLTGISDDVRKDFRLMRSFADITRVGPTRRCNTIFQFLERVYGCPEAKEYLDSWGVQFKKELVTVPARLFDLEKIDFYEASIPVNSNTYDWTNNLRSVKLLNPAEIKKWCVYYSYREQGNVDAFLQIVFDKAQAFGMSLSDPDLIEINVENSHEVLRAFESNIKKEYDLSMFIIPPNRKDIYDMIKVKSCVDHPMTTQVILSSTLRKKNAIQGIASKVVIQLCVKRGGEPWAVSIPVKNKMVVGIDVCHDTESKRNSWLGFVASLNNNFTRYFSRATRQPAKTEVADSLNVNMKAALDAYYKLNRGLPDAIYVFRDGVGDGQLELVKLQEIPAVLARLEAIYADYGSTPTLAYIIVRKRINTRLFSKVQNEAVNPIPGSIVDRVVTKDDYPNYYLISQKVTQGTVNPTHYIVLHNNTRLPTNNLQRLSYKLCHLYFNWTGTVRVPAPCQYAHKLCFLVSQSIKKEPSNALSNLLYYL